MPVMEITTQAKGRTPDEVRDFCLEGRHFLKTFPGRIILWGDIDLQRVIHTARYAFRWLRGMFGLKSVDWAVAARGGCDRHVIDAMLKGPMWVFRHEHWVEVGEDGTLYRLGDFCCH
ncbi:polyketide cyclase [Pseudomonas sp. FW300-N1A1]|uniref:polyketide cyclase n=1 Tax=Pseudomonas sp. FW300-N1A1 TaxID=2075555 RepID=UPI0021153C43|nr:polyketide cyclase [Pseudomonas sp. FW300-N1A1]